MLGKVQSAGQTLLQRQRELHGFLCGWQGNPEALGADMTSCEQALNKAR